MKYYTSILLLGLASCGQSPPATAIDADLAPYFEMFENAIGVSTEGISGKIDEISSAYLGTCTLDEAANIKLVEINKYYWARSTDDERENTVFHELGHCAMGLSHINTLDKYGCPTSIMYYAEFPHQYCFELFRQNYYDELRSHKPNQ